MSDINYNNLTSKELKTLEQRLRRKLQKDEQFLRKGRGNNSNGYMIVDENNNLVAGGSPNAYSMSVDDVVKYVESE